MDENKLSDNSCTDDVVAKHKSFGVRHLQMAAILFTIISLIIARGSMAVAVLAMAEKGGNTTESSIPVYKWDKHTQSLILSSFFWGYVIMQIPSGLLTKKFGTKPILLISLLINGCLCGLVPILASLGDWPLVCAARMAMGLTQACLFPGTHTLLGQWLPPHEFTFYTGIVSGGIQIGTIIAIRAQYQVSGIRYHIVSGLLANTALGWKLIFYTMSGLLFLTAAVWYFFAASTPADHRLISEAERHYIESSLNSTTEHSSMPTPWKQILTSAPVLSLIPMHIAVTISFTLFFVDMPTYLEKALQLSSMNSASLSALPYVGKWISITSSVAIADKIINKKILSIIACRRVFNSIGTCGSATCLLVLSFLGPENKGWAIASLIGILTMHGFTYAGFVVNYLDLSPNFAGVLYSLTSFIANFGSLLTPILTGVILQNDPTDVSRWRIVFLIVSITLVATNIIYVVFSSSDRQPWNDPDYLDKKTAHPEEMVAVIITPEQKENDTKEDQHHLVEINKTKLLVK